MLISFIITYYNEPLWMLKECVQSVLDLCTDVEREIIVIDDGSIVSPELELLKMHGDIKVIRQENKGLSAARNLGLKYAQGCYIQFIDADDALLPSYRSVLSLIKPEKQSFGKAEPPSVVQFRFNRRRNSQGLNDKEQHFSKNLAVFSGTRYLETHNLNQAVCSYVFRRDSLGDLRFEEGILHEDELFTPQLFVRAKQVIQLDAKAYFYRQRKGSITTSATSSDIKKRLDDTEHILMTLKELCTQHRSLKRRVNQLTMDYIYNMFQLNSCEKYSRFSRLKQSGLLPLPLMTYTWKYYFFALLTRIMP